jgi:acyl carrier protein phosphodiesterase
MAAQDWLGSYREFEVLHDVLAGMSRRLSRPALLDGAWAELERLYVPLSDDFLRFYPELLAHVRTQREGLGDRP